MLGKFVWQLCRVKFRLAKGYIENLMEMFRIGLIDNLMEMFRIGLIEANLSSCRHLND